MLDDLYCQPKEDIVMGSFIEKQHPELPIEHGPKKENSEASRKKIRRMQRYTELFQNNNENGITTQHKEDSKKKVFHILRVFLLQLLLAEVTYIFLYQDTFYNYRINF